MARVRRAGRRRPAAVCPSRVCTGRRPLRVSSRLVSEPVPGLSLALRRRAAAAACAIGRGVLGRRESRRLAAPAWPCWCAWRQSSGRWWRRRGSGGWSPDRHGWWWFRWWSRRPGRRWGSARGSPPLALPAASSMALPDRSASPLPVRRAGRWFQWSRSCASPRAAGPEELPGSNFAGNLLSAPPRCRKDRPALGGAAPEVHLSGWLPGPGRSCRADHQAVPRCVWRGWQAPSRGRGMLRRGTARPYAGVDPLCRLLTESGQPCASTSP